MRPSLLRLRLTLSVLTLGSVAYAAACFLDWLPTLWLSLTPGAAYAANMVSVCLTLCGFYAVCRLPRTHSVLRGLRTHDSHAAWLSYCRLCALRTGLTGAMLWWNILAYYAAPELSGSLYCWLISLVCVAFTHASRGEYRRLRTISSHS